jgi:hypothetical protein
MNYVLERSVKDKEHHKTFVKITCKPAKIPAEYPPNKFTIP